MLMEYQVKSLRSQFGDGSVIASDIKGGDDTGPFEVLDVTNFDHFEDVVKRHKVVQFIANEC